MIELYKCTNQNQKHSYPATWYREYHHLTDYSTKAQHFHDVVCECVKTSICNGDNTDGKCKSVSHIKQPSPENRVVSLQYTFLCMHYPINHTCSQ
jgi:hypothetical protein